MPKLKQAKQLERDQQAEKGYLWCPQHEAYLPKENFSHWNWKWSNYGHKRHCKECSRQWRYGTKDKAVFTELMGSHCQRCGFKHSLSFCNITTKQIINLRNYTYESSEEQLDHCCLLCPNCISTFKTGLWNGKFTKREGLGYAVL